VLIAPYEVAEREAGSPRSRGRPPKRDLVVETPSLGGAFAHGTVEKLHSHPKHQRGRLPSAPLISATWWLRGLDLNQRPWVMSPFQIGAGAKTPQTMHRKQALLSRHLWVSLALVGSNFLGNSWVKYWGSLTGLDNDFLGDSWVVALPQSSPRAPYRCGRGSHSRIAASTPSAIFEILCKQALLQAREYYLDCKSISAAAERPGLRGRSVLARTKAEQPYLVAPLRSGPAHVGATS
jgi:hypothetical protein